MKQGLHLIPFLLLSYGCEWFTLLRQIFTKPEEIQCFTKSVFFIKIIWILSWTHRCVLSTRLESTAPRQHEERQEMKKGTEIHFFFPLISVLCFSSGRLWFAGTSFTLAVVVLGWLGRAGGDFPDDAVPRCDTTRQCCKCGLTTHH